MSSKEELLALTVCKTCGCRDVPFLTVPGGWLEFTCDKCGSSWWHESGVSVRKPR